MPDNRVGHLLFNKTVQDEVVLIHITRFPRCLGANAIALWIFTFEAAPQALNDCREHAPLLLQSNFSERVKMCRFYCRD